MADLQEVARRCNNITYNVCMRARARIQVTFPLLEDTLHLLLSSDLGSRDDSAFNPADVCGGQRTVSRFQYHICRLQEAQVRLVQPVPREGVRIS